MKCEKCGEAIPRERLAVLPETTTCVKCSRVKPILASDLDLDSSSDVTLSSDGYKPEPTVRRDRG